MITQTSQTDQQHPDAVAGEPRSAAGEPRSAAGELRPAAGESARLLLVEDDATLRRYLAVVLRRAGYEVAEAADGLEALKLALSSRFSVVVTDSLMPRLGGPELCRLLRARADTTALPVVMLTGLDAASHSTDDAAAKPDARLTKPVRADELLDCLSRLLARAG